MTRKKLLGEFKSQALLAVTKFDLHERIRTAVQQRVQYIPRVAVGGDRTRHSAPFRRMAREFDTLTVPATNNGAARSAERAAR
jgi:hypothetical protein